MPRSATVLLFATARLAVGRGRLRWALDAGGATARSLIRELGDRYPDLAPVLKGSRFVLNGRYLNDLRVRVRPGDEFAVHPPYGGG